MTTSVVVLDDASQTRAAVAGFLAGYCGATRRSYATDLRIFAAWCADVQLELFGVRRAHLELSARWMEENGKMRSTVARRLSTLASFYRYCEQGGLIERNPPANVRRPKVDYESRTLGLNRNEFGGRCGHLLAVKDARLLQTDVVNGSSASGLDRLRALHVGPDRDVCRPTPSSRSVESPRTSVKPRP